MRASADRSRRPIRGRLHARARAMSEPEHAKWDERHRGQPVGEPEPFLVEMIPRIRRGGIVLDVAAGRGRNAIAMARVGNRAGAGDFLGSAMRAPALPAGGLHLGGWPAGASLGRFYL